LTRPLVNYYQDREKLHTVEGHASPDQVHAEIFRILRKVCGLKGNSCSN